MNERTEQLLHIFVDQIYTAGYVDGTNNTAKEFETELKRAKEDGLAEAWECARKLMLSTEDSGIDPQKVEEIFGYSYYEVLQNDSASEAIAKIKEYEEKQKKADEIKVGDEVQSCDTRYIVVRIRDNGTFEAIGACGTDEGLDLSKFHKTGRHFDEIEKIMEQIIGDSE
jgi:hypothetical protein